MSVRWEVLLFMVLVEALAHCHVDDSGDLRKRVLLLARRFQLRIILLDSIECINLLLHRWHGRGIFLRLRYINKERLLLVELLALL